MKIKYTYLTIALSFLLVSCKGGQPKVTSDYLFGESFKEFTKKFGNISADRRTCETPPDCDYYYLKVERIGKGCLERGMNVRANHKTGNVTWVNLSFGGKCNGIDDNLKLASSFQRMTLLQHGSIMINH